MEQIVTIAKESVPYAMLWKSVEANGGVRFLTQPTDEFQVGVMERPKGHTVEPHTHPRGERVMQGFSEFLYIESGSIRVTVFDEQWNELGQETLGKGDFLLFIRGGHSIEMLEESRMIEVKQGPYTDAFTAKSFRPAA